MTATISATPHVLSDDLYHALVQLRRANRTERGDHADRVLSKALARVLWDKGWRNREDVVHVVGDGQQNLLENQESFDGLEGA